MPKYDVNAQARPCSASGYGPLWRTAQTTQASVTLAGRTSLRLCHDIRVVRTGSRARPDDAYNCTVHRGDSDSDLSGTASRSTCSMGLDSHQSLHRDSPDRRNNLKLHAPSSCSVRACPPSPLHPLLTNEAGQRLAVGHGHAPRRTARGAGPSRRPRNSARGLRLSGGRPDQDSAW